MTLIHIFQIIISVVLILLVLLQVKGGGLGGIFGFEASVFRTRRGIEKSIFRLTVALAVIFIVIALVTVRF